MKEETIQAGNISFQGDVCFQKVDDIPEGLMRGQAEDGRYIVAHSETGHHHTIDANAIDYFLLDDFTAYAKVNKPAKVIHNRSFDTHKALQLPIGTYKIIRQRESTPDGWRRVAD